MSSIDDAADACADALLSVAALDQLPPRDIHRARAAAIAAIDRVIEQTRREGARPRA